MAGFYSPMTETKSQQKKDFVTYDSKQLFEGGKVVLIEHAGSVYRLIITRQDKLILNK